MRMLTLLRAAEIMNRMRETFEIVLPLVVSWPITTQQHQEGFCSTDILPRSLLNLICVCV